MQRLTSQYFARDTREVARDLVGQLLVHELGRSKRLVARIVETEAYKQDDRACHAYVNHKRLEAGKPLIGRSTLLFGPPGVAYVYLNYGVHWLFNVVTEANGVAGAVLLRAVEPLEGLEDMIQRRPVKKPFDLTNGPGKLSAALAIGREKNGVDLSQGPLYFASAPGGLRPAITTATRIGITKAASFPWRFYDSQSPYVSVRS